MALEQLFSYSSRLVTCVDPITRPYLIKSQPLATAMVERGRLGDEREGGGEKRELDEEREFESRVKGHR